MLSIRQIIRESILIAENVQQADKVYFKTGKLSQEAKRYIVHITGGDALTKIISDIYYAELQQSIKNGRWAVAGIGGGDEEEESDPRDTEDRLHTDNDVMGIEEWKKIRAYHNQLKEYNKNVFPMKGYNPNGVKDVWELIRSLNERAKILEDLKKLPSIAIRNMKGDIRLERNGGELQKYRNDLEYFLAYYSLINNKSERAQRQIQNKMFTANITLYDLLRFVDEKNNLVSDIKITKNTIKKVVNEDDPEGELEIIYDKGHVMVVEVSGPHGIKKIGCNSLWCFTYGKGFDIAWNQWHNYSTNGLVYVIIDFSVPSDSPEFMHTLIKPLDYESESSEEEDPNDRKLFDMYNEESYNAIGVVSNLVGLENAQNLFLFGEEPVSPEDKILNKHKGEKSPWPYQDPNQTKLDLQELRKYVREKLLEEAKKTKFKKLEDNKIPLTDEERKQVMDAKATWNHGPNGEPTPAVWKSKKSNGDIVYITNTHRAYQDRPTLKGAISIYHSFIKGTS